MYVYIYVTTMSFSGYVSLASIARAREEKAEIRAAMSPADKTRECLLDGLTKSHGAIICLSLIGADGTACEPHLTFNPCLPGVRPGKKQYTDEEKREKLKSVKIRVTLDTYNKAGTAFKRIGPIGNITVDSIITVASSGDLERSINEFFPGARFDPPFAEQFANGVNRMG
jgi:hypothetical protein